MSSDSVILGFSWRFVLVIVCLFIFLFGVLGFGGGVLGLGLLGRRLGVSREFSRGKGMRK